MTASQDCMIRIYDTERGKFTWKKSIEVRADGESVPGLTDSSSRLVTSAGPYLT